MSIGTMKTAALVMAGTALEHLNARVAALTTENSNLRAALAQQGAAQAQAGDDFAVRFIERRSEQYLIDHADTDPETGATVFEFGEAGRDYHSSLVELAEEIRAAMAAPATSGGGNG